MEGKTKMSNKKFKRIWVPILATVLVLAVAVNIAIQVFESYANNYLGYGTYEIVNEEGAAGWDTEYFKSDYADAAAAREAALLTAQEVQADGIVLMKNNGTLPLAKGGDVTMLGRSAADPIYGGSGSGGVDTSSAATARSGLETSGFKINEVVFNILETFSSFKMEEGMFGSSKVYDNPKTNIIMDDPENSIYFIGEMPVTAYSAEAIESFKNFDDAAIVYIGRGGGEGGDLSQDISGWDDNYVAGQHQLELNKDEKDMIELAKANFENVIIVLNSSSAMELGELEADEDVDAIVWIGSPGEAGFAAVGQVLCGDVNPSGRTADIYASDFTKDPTFVNFGNYAYNNVEGYFVQYEESIYYGYRYYETAALEGFINYEDAVVYPFGHGLSYTTFSWEVVNETLGNADGNIEVEVKVTNTGDVAGKEVVQMYYSAPYTAGGIEKSHVVLGDFAKTGILAPGASETVTLVIVVEEMASYDYKNEKAYVLDAGEYQILIQTDSHSIKDGVEPIAYTVEEKIVYSGENHRASDSTAVTNQFDDISELFVDTAESGKITNFSRADFEGTFPTAPTDADMTANEAIVAGFAAYDAAAVNAESDIEMPTTGAKNGLSLVDLRGKDYTDPLWETLLDQLTVNDMMLLLLTGAYHTEAINSIVKPMVTDLDGPAGFTSFMGNISCTAFPSAVVIASTFNKELSYKLGVAIGNEGLANDISGWYAPAMNIHRSPFAGRNFEYYSEDPVLSGIIGERCASGAASKGVYSFVKHFALNDQETNRVNNGISTWANEQAMREIYLKPFEITIKNVSYEVSYISDDKGTIETKEYGATAVMSSFNRIGATWAGGSVPLMNTVLRGEWGFEGFVITDFNLYDYMVPDQGIKAGSDLMLTFTPMKSMQDGKSAASVSDMRGATKNILFTVVNSNAMNGIAPGADIVYKAPLWRNIQLAVNIALAVLWVAALVWVIKRVKKNKETVEVISTAKKDKE